MRARLRKKLRQQGERQRAYYEAAGIPYYIEERKLLNGKHYFALLHAMAKRDFPSSNIISTDKSNNSWFEYGRMLLENTP